MNSATALKFPVTPGSLELAKRVEMTEKARKTGKTLTDVTISFCAYLMHVYLPFKVTEQV